jgi:hypothetical protein
VLRIKLLWFQPPTLVTPLHHPSRGNRGPGANVLALKPQNSSRSTEISYLQLCSWQIDTASGKSSRRLAILVRTSINAHRAHHGRASAPEVGAIGTYTRLLSEINSTLNPS